MAHTRTTLEGAKVDCACPADADHDDVGVVQDEPGGSLTDTVAERPDIITGMAEVDPEDE